MALVLKMYGYVLKRLVDFLEIWLEGDATQGDLDVKMKPTHILFSKRYRIANPYILLILVFTILFSSLLFS
jgi:hypothetical protein